MQQVVLASIRYFAVCRDCAAQAEWWGVQALVGDELRWDVECLCATCGFAVAICDGDLPAHLRNRLLAEHGHATLRVAPPVQGAKVMRVLRAELGLDLTDVRAALERALTGTHSGTLPEVEHLARRLRASGIDATAEPPTVA
ncbi:hypothetical protein [Embleya scabrispora]|uniref:hypothetical protein n=1 Tax=Embleya scabrispora TaxID=159449 RepID=UPI001F2EC593|nr:hypothetical protein [Embleya scabrispora]